ncbi:MAG: hypothetical protein K0S47_3554 [Herbinix sp.]|jgi:hypothetical protein|nr:hypothetical protein [Herbinix sp.]
MSEKKQNIIIALLLFLILLLVGINSSYKNKLSYLEQQIQLTNSSLSSQMSQLSYTFGQMESNFNKSLSDIVSYGFTYEDLSAENNTVKLKMNFDVKELGAGSKFYISYTPLDEASYTEIEAQSVGGTSYQSELELSIDHNYKFNIIEKNKEGLTKQLNTEEITYHVYNDFKANRLEKLSSDFGVNDNQLNYNYFFINHTYGEEAFEVKTVEFYLYYGDEVVYYEDITDQNLIENNEVKINANSYDDPYVKEEVVGATATEMIVDKDMYQYNYQISIPKKDLNEKYPELYNEDLNYMGVLKSSIVITFQNGDTIEY